MIYHSNQSDYFLWNPILCGKQKTTKRHPNFFNGRNKNNKAGNLKHSLLKFSKYDIDNSLKNDLPLLPVNLEGNC